MRDKDFVELSPREGVYIGIDFGSGDDISVESTAAKQPDGSIKIMSVDIIGRASQFSTEEKRNQYLKRYENS